MSHQKMSEETLRSLDTIRKHLQSLSTSLGVLQRDVMARDPLPSWPSMQNSAALLSQHLANLHRTMAEAEPMLKSAHVHPMPSFPGRTQEDLLGQLLRKKLQPQVEDWIEEGKKQAASVVAPANLSNGNANPNTNGANGTHGHPANGISAEELEDLWNWVGPEGNRIAREMPDDAFDDVFTLQEQEDGIENVLTGLRRKMWESEDEDDDDEDEAGQKRQDKADKMDKMDVDAEDQTPEHVKKLMRPGVDPSRPPMLLETILKFSVTGKEPATIVAR